MRMKVGGHAKVRKKSFVHVEAASPHAFRIRITRGRGHPAQSIVVRNPEAHVLLILLARAIFARLDPVTDSALLLNLNHDKD